MSRTRCCARLLTALVAVACACAPVSAHAAIVTWSATGTNTAIGGTGTWDTTALQWTANGSTWSAWNNANNDVAWFGGTAGTVTLNAPITANGLTFATDGYLLTGGTITFAGTTPTITASSSVTGTVGSILAGSTSLTKQGAGTVVLSGVNTYSGGTELLAGTISASAMSGVGTGYLAVKTGGTFAYTGSGTESITRTLWLDNGASTINVTNSTGRLTWAPGAGTRSAAFTKTGAGTLEFTNAVFSSGASVTLNGGTLILSGANTNTGGTTISSGTLILGNASGLGATSGALAVNGGTLDLRGNSVTVGVLSGSSGGLITSNTTGNVTFTGSSASSGTFGGSITNGSGAVTLTKTGAGRLEFTGTGSSITTLNVNSGTFAVTSGSIGASNLLSLTSAQLLISGGILSGSAIKTGNASGAAGTVTQSSGTLTITGNVTNSQSTSDSFLISHWSGGATTTWNMSGGVLNSTSAAMSLGWDSAATFTQTGGTANLLGINLANGRDNSATYNLNGGRLNIGSSGITANTNKTVNLGSGTLGALAAWSSSQNMALTSASPGVMIDPSNGGITLSGILSGAGALSVNGSGTLTLSGNNTYTGGSTITAGTLRIGSGSTSGSATGGITNNGTLIFERSDALTYSGTISGAGVLTKLGGGQLTLTGTGSTVSSVNLNSGTLSLTSGSIAAAGTVSVVAATLNIAGGIMSGSSVVTTNNSGSPTSLITMSSGTLIVTGSNNTNSTSASFLLAHWPGTTTWNMSGGVLTSTSAVMSFGWDGTPTFTQTGGTASLLGINLLGSVPKNSAATYNLNGGRLNIGSSGISTNSSKTINLGSGTLGALATWSSSQNMNLTSASPGVTVDPSGFGITLSGNLSGAGSLVVNGAGTLTLAASNGFTGSTTVTSGTLNVGSASALLTTSSVTINPGGVATINANNWFLAGHGAAAADSRVITVNGGSIIFSSSNDSRIGNLTLTNGGTFTSNRSVTTAYEVLLANVQSGTWATVSVTGNAVSTMNGTGGIHLQGMQNFDVADVTGDGNADLAVSMILGDPGQTGGAAGGVNKAGAGTMAISTQTQYTGGTVINAGVLDLTGGGGSGGVIRGSATVNSGAVLRLSTGTATGSGGGATSLTAINLVGGTLSVSTTANQVLGSGTINLTGGAITGTAGSNLDFLGGDSALTSLASAVTSTVSGVALSPLRQGSTTFTVAAGTTPSGVDLEIASVIQNGPSGSPPAGAQFIKAGTGLLRFTGANTYTGTTAINAGTLQIGGNGTTGVLPDAATVAAGALLAFNRSDAPTYSGAIAGAGTVSQIGSGTLTLSGNSTYTGTTSLAAGAVELGSAGAIGSSGTITFGGGTLRYSASNSTDYSGRFSTAAGQAYRIDTNSQNVTYAAGLTSSGGSLVKLGSGTLTLSGSNTYSGNTTISAGVLRLGSGGAGGSVAGNIANAGTLVFNRSDALGIPGVISGAGAVVQAGSGTTTLAVANTYSGATTITGGALSVSQDANLGTAPGSITAGSLVLNGGALSAASSFTLSPNRGIALGPATGSGTGTIDVAGSLTALTYAGVIADNAGGTDALVKTGLGTLVLAGTSTYSGDTAVNAGTLQVTGSLASPNLAVAAGAALAGTGAVNATTVASGGALTPGVVTPGIGGVGTLSLSSVTFSGAGTINVGVQTGTVASLLNVVGSVTTTVTASSVTFAFGNNLSAINTGTYTLLSYSGTQLSDITAFTYSGATGARQSVTIVNATNAVNMEIGNAFPIWTGTDGGGWSTADNWKLNTTGSATSFLPNDTVVFNDSADTGNVTLSTDVNPSTTTFTGTTLAYTISSSNGFGITTGALVKSGPAALTISTSNAFSGGTTLSAGTIRIGNDAALGTGVVTVTGSAAGMTISSDGGSARSLANNLTVNGDVTLGDATNSGVLTFSGTTNLGAATRTVTTPSNVTLSGFVTSGGFTKQGAGTLTITGANNDFSLGTTLASGSLVVTAANGLGSGPTTVNNGVLSATGTGAIGSGAVTLNSGTILAGSNAALGTQGVTLNGGEFASLDTSPRTLTNAFTIGGTVTLGDTVNTGALTLGSVGGIALGSAVRQITTDADVTFAGTVTGVGGGITKLGTATLTLSSSNGYTGGTTLSAGTLVVGNASALGSGNLTLAAGVTFRSTVGGTIANSVVAGAVSGTFDSAANAVTLSGTVSGSGGLVKVGSGTLALSGNNSFAGGMTLNAGQLNLNSATALGAGTFTVAGGAIGNASGGAITLSTNNAQLWNADFSFAGSSPLALGSGAVTLGGNRTVTVSSSTLTVGGAIGGASSLTKAGAGTLSLSGASGYSGGTTLSAGTLLVGNAAALGTGTVTLNGGALNLNAFTIGNGIVLGGGTLAGNGGTLSGVVADGSATTFSVGSSITLTGTSAYSGSTTITGGTLTIGGAGQLGGGSYTAAISNAGSLAVATSASQTLGGAISGTGSLSKSGAGALTLTGPSTFSGSVSLSAGQLNLNGTQAIGTGTLTITGGTLGNTSGSALTLANNNAQAWNGDFSFAGTSPLNLGTGAVTLGGGRTMTVTSSTLTIGGVVSGAFSLTKAGTGTLVLSGNNSYSGGTTVNAGLLLITGASTVATGGNTTINGGTLKVSGANAFLYNSTTYNTSSVVQINAGGTVEIDSFAYGAQAGGGSLGAISAYSNQRLLNGGTINIAGSTQASACDFRVLSGASGAFNMLTAGQTLTLNDNVNDNIRLGGPLTFGGAGNIVVSEAIQDNTTAGSIVKAATGALTLSASNTFTGGVSLTAGQLNLGNARGIGTGTLTLAGGTLDNTSGSSLTLGNNNVQSWTGSFAFAGSNPLNLGTGAVTLAASPTVTVTSSTLTVGGAIGGAFALTKSGAGTLALTGANTYSAGTTLSQGTLSFTSGALGSQGTVTLGGGSLLWAAGNTQDISARLALSNATTTTLDVGSNDVALGSGFGASSTGGLAKAGAGTLTLSGSNGFSGGLSFGAGTVAVGNDFALGSGTVAMSGGVLSSNGAIARSLPNALAFTADVTLGSAANTGALSFAGGVDLGGVARQITTPSDVTFAGSVTNGGLTKTGAGTLSLTGASDYTGGTQVNAGTLAFASGGLGSSGTVAIANGATLRWASGNTQDISSRIALPSSGVGTLDVTSGNNVSLAGAFASGTVGSLTKTGAGTLTISGTPGYTGITTISGGTLAVAGANSLASSQLSIAPNASLDISAAAGLVNVGALTAAADAAMASVVLGSGTLRSDVAGGSVTFGGVIGGSGGFTKAGAGTLTITQLQDFEGAARVEAGTLSLYSLDPGGDKLLQNASAILVAAGATLDASPSGLAVVAGQTLGGYGTVDVGSNALVFEANSILSPGGSVGPLTTTGTVAFTGPMSYVFDVNDASGTAGGPNGWDLYTATSFTFTGFDTNTNQFVVDLTSLSGTTPNQDAANFNPSFNYAWKFLVASDLNPISVTNGWFRVDTTNFTNSPHPGNFYVARGDQLGAIGGSGDTNALYVVYAAVPEPGSLALAGIGLAAAAWAASRRRHGSNSRRTG